MGADGRQSNVFRFPLRVTVGVYAACRCSLAKLERFTAARPLQFSSIRSDHRPWSRAPFPVRNRRTDFDRSLGHVLLKPPLFLPFTVSPCPFSRSVRSVPGACFNLFSCSSPWSTTRLSFLPCQPAPFPESRTLLLPFPSSESSVSRLASHSFRKLRHSSVISGPILHLELLFPRSKPDSCVDGSIPRPMIDK